jgi:hypothetical protein
MTRKEKPYQETTGNVSRRGHFGRRFSSFSEINTVVNNPETAKQYKIGWIDWTNNVLEIERKL